MFLIEFIKNTNLKQGRYFAKDIEGTNTGEYAGGDVFNINSVIYRTTTKRRSSLEKFEKLSLYSSLFSLLK